MPAKPTLQDDTCGAIMVIAVFMAMIAIGALYYMVGLGDAILAQERMQDAADAAAFSGAVIHARGMNILALLNIIMASLLAILVMLSMLSSLFKAAVVVLAAIAWFVPPAASLIPYANTASQGFSRAEKAAKGPAHSTIKALHALQGPINTAVPALASLNAAKLSSNNYGEVVTLGITFPVFKGLPTKEGSFDALCKKAGEYAGALVAKPINAIFGNKGFIKNSLLKRAKGLGATYASFYCGDGPKPSVPSFEEEVAIPKLDTPEQASCSEDKEQKACDQYAEQIKSLNSSYDEYKGRCFEGRKSTSLCEEIKERARDECNPVNNDKFIRKYTWIERRYTLRWTIEGEGDSKHVRKHDPTNDRYKPMEGVGRGHMSKASRTPIPCHDPSNSFNNREMTKWDESRPPDEPLCETKPFKPTVKQLETLGGSYDREILEVTDVLRCTVEEEIVIELDGDPMKSDAKESMAPQEMCSCAELGEEDFQVRAVILGNAEVYTKEADKRILVATQGEASPDNAMRSLAKYGGRVAAAQAEFYFDAKKTRSEWLWHLKWKARMRRLSFKREAYQCKVKDTCSKSQMGFGEGLDDKGLKLGGGNKDKLSRFRNLLEGANQIIVH